MEESDWLRVFWLIFMFISFQKNEISLSCHCSTLSLLFTTLSTPHFVDSTSIECESPLVPVTLSRIYGDSAYKETYEIRKGDGLTGELVYSENGLNKDTTTTTKELCLENTLHTIVLLSAYGLTISD